MALEEGYWGEDFWAEYWSKGYWQVWEETVIPDIMGTLKIMAGVRMLSVMPTARALTAVPAARRMQVTVEV
jgi:hypothetical protein